MCFLTLMAFVPLPVLCRSCAPSLPAALFQFTLTCLHGDLCLGPRPGSRPWLGLWPAEGTAAASPAQLSPRNLPGPGPAPRLVHPLSAQLSADLELLLVQGCSAPCWHSAFPARVCSVLPVALGWFEVLQWKHTTQI